ncbi:MAG: class II aldolase/adducin family protein [Betaproteobacteria bacterium]|nr:class II aldolase/adducin family protein [Betaproteobacteria bacterium]
MNLILDLVIASRTLAEHGVIDAYGHASVRSDRDPQRYFMSRSIPPELITAADIMEFDLDSKPVDAQGRAMYNERYIHGEIYKARPEVQAIVHNHSPSVVPYSCTDSTLKPIFHMSAFIGLGVPNWDIRDAQEGSDLLVRTPYLGQALARRLGGHPAALMRGHGAVVVGENIQRAVGRSIYLEMNARMQFQATLLAGAEGRIVFMDDKEVAANTSWQNYERSWQLWKTRALATLAREDEGRRATGSA